MLLLRLCTHYYLGNLAWRALTDKSNGTTTFDGYAEGHKSRWLMVSKDNEPLSNFDGKMVEEIINP